MHRSLVRNLLFIYLFNFVWAFGNPMINSSTMIASYFEAMSAPSIVLAMVQVCTSLPVLIQLVPRLLKFDFIKNRRTLLICYEINGALFVLYGLLVYFQPVAPDLLTPLLLLVYFSIFCASQLAMILYLDYISSLFDSKMLGRFYGGVGFFQAIASVLGGLAATQILSANLFPENYGIIYLLAGCIFMVASLFIAFTRPTQESHCQTPVVNGVRGYLSYLYGILKIPIVRYFALLMMLVYINQIPYGFALFFLNRQMDMNIDPSVATIVAYLSQSVLILVVGWCLDKIGQFKAIGLYMALISLANVIILLPFKYSFVAIFGLYGMYNLFISMIKVRIGNVTLPPDIRFDAIALVNVLGVLVGGVVSFVYGIISSFIGGSVTFVFILSAINIAAVFAVLLKLSRCVTKH